MSNKWSIARIGYGRIHVPERCNLVATIATATHHVVAHILATTVTRIIALAHVSATSCKIQH